MKIRIIVGEQIVTGRLYTNPTASDFASLLPLSLTLTSYESIELIAELPRKLSTQDAPEGMAPLAGELTHYTPWCNLAIFTQHRSWSRDLLPLGVIDQGLEILSHPGPYNLRIELDETDCSFEKESL